MRFVRFGKEERLGAMMGENEIVDLNAAYWSYLIMAKSDDPYGKAAALMPASMEEYLRLGRGAFERAAQTVEYCDDKRDRLAASARRVIYQIDHVTLHPPLPSLASRIFCIGGNFVDHVANVHKLLEGDELQDRECRELIVRSPIWGFYKLPQTIMAPDADVPIPPWVKAFDYELELAGYVGIEGRNFTLDQARKAIVGYACFFDWSIRDAHFVEGAKNFDDGPLSFAFQKNAAGASLGPYLVMEDNINPYHLRMETRVNGQVRQSCAAGDMVFKLDEIVAHISKFVMLYPGDIVTSGTCAGTAFDSSVLLKAGAYGEGDLRVAPGLLLDDGDIVEGSIEGLGTLRHRITDEG